MSADLQKKRLVYPDLLRILAILLVIYNHTGRDGYMLFASTPVFSLSFVVNLLTSILCTVNVPLFLAVSGALMLGREPEPLSVLVKKRMGRIMLLLVFWSGAYYIAGILRYGGEMSLAGFVQGLYTSSIKGHLWYLYAYLAYLPLMQQMVKGLQDKYLVWLLALAVFFRGILPTAEYLLTQGGASVYTNLKPVMVTTDVLIFPVLGYYVNQRLNISKKGRTLGIAWAVMLAGIVCTFLMVCYKAEVRETFGAENEQKFLSLFNITTCYGLMVTARCLENKIPAQVGKLIGTLGKCTFGLYLIHMFIREITPIYFLPETLTGMGVNPMLACWADILIIAVIGYFITWLLLKIPGVRKLVG